MTVNETFFFRDRQPFEGFRQAVLPELLKSRARNRRLRIWSAACSTGQEPYSLAMILDEEARSLMGWTVDIIASDIADTVLKKAKDGVYTHFEVQRGVPMPHLVRYFTKRKDQWAVNQNIKSRVDFRQLNLMSDFSHLGVFDVIFCRNVLIYFAPDQKRDVLNRIARCLAPDGYLVLGAAESVIGYSTEFKPHAEHRVILRRAAAGQIWRRRGAWRSSAGRPFFSEIHLQMGPKMPTSSRVLSALLDQHVAPTFVLDCDGDVIVWNRACVMLTGMPAEAVLGTKNHWKAFYASERPCVADLVVKDAIEWAPEYFVAFSDSQVAKGALSAETWWDLPIIGRRGYFSGTASPIFDPDGALIGVMEAIQDLTAAKDAESKLRNLAGLDGLTGLANRRSFDETLQREWRRAMRTRAPLSLLMIDLDHFKSYNDNFGHAGGDQCLTTVAKVIADCGRRTVDLAARYGGEEFALVLPETDAQGAALIAEDIAQIP